MHQIAIFFFLLQFFIITIITMLLLYFSEEITHFLLISSILILQFTSQNIENCIKSVLEFTKNIVDQKSTGRNGAELQHTLSITRDSHIHTKITTNNPVSITFLDNLSCPSTRAPYVLNFQGGPLYPTFLSIACLGRGVLPEEKGTLYLKT